MAVAFITIAPDWVGYREALNIAPMFAERQKATVESGKKYL